MKLEEMKLAEIGYETTEVKVSDELTIDVRSFLTTEEKVKFIEYVLNSAMDDAGCFSPIRVEVFYSLALCKFYADIDIGEVTPMDAYDKLEYHGVIDLVNNAIPIDERTFIHEVVVDTVEDVSRYNSSAAGIIRMMSGDASDLDAQITEILGKIERKEGIETLSAIKDVVGKGPVVVKRS